MYLHKIQLFPSPSGVRVLKFTEIADWIATLSSSFPSPFGVRVLKFL